MARININGTNGDDFLTADRAANINGKGGLDDIFGSDFADSIRGGAGNDFIFGGAGNDTVYGDNGNDQINADDGSDRVFGGAGNDTIHSLFGPDTDKDTIDGGDGKDVLEFDSFTTVTGGAGADVFRMFPSIRQDVPVPIKNVVITDFQDGIDKFAIQTFGFYDFSHVTTQRVDADTVNIKVYADTNTTLGADNALVATLTLDHFTGTITAADFIG